MGPNEDLEGVTALRDATAPKVDVSTNDNAAKSLHDVLDYVRSVKDLAADSDVALNDEINKRFAKVDADLTDALKSLKLAEARAKMDTSRGTEDDALLRGYVLPEVVRGAGPNGRDLPAGSVIVKGYFDKDAQEYVPGILDTSDKSANHPWLRRFRQLVTERNVAFLLLGGDKARATTPIANKRITNHLRSTPAIFAKAAGWGEFTKIFGDVSGAGADWIISLGVPALVDDNPYIYGQLESVFGVYDMPAKTVLMPAFTTGLRPYKKIPANIDDPSQLPKSSIVTAQKQLDAVGMSVYTQMDLETEEDAILRGMPIIIQQLSIALRDGWEDCAINGDTDATHRDTALTSWNIASRWGASGLGGSLDHRRTFDGLRKIAADQSNRADYNASQDFSGIINATATLTGSGGMTGTSVLLTSKAWFIKKIVAMTEFRTAELVRGIAANEGGAMAVPRVAGHRIIVSSFVSDAQAATGLYTGSGALTSALLFEPGPYRVLRRAGDVIATDVDITRDIRRLVAKNRKGFDRLHTSSSTAVDVAEMYNLST